MASHGSNWTQREPTQVSGAGLAAGTRSSCRCSLPELLGQPSLNPQRAANECGLARNQKGRPLGDADGVRRFEGETFAPKKRAPPQRVIRSLLLEWDGIGAGVPDDEYDCMIGPLCKLIHQRSSIGEIAVWDADRRRDHFGLEADREVPEWTEGFFDDVAAFDDEELAEAEDDAAARSRSAGSGSSVSP
jgi:hypothetical protein